jgi:hypothetical protein
MCIDIGNLKIHSLGSLGIGKFPTLFWGYKTHPETHPEKVK